MTDEQFKSKEQELEALAAKFVVDANNISPQGAWYASQFAIAGAYDTSIEAQGANKGHRLFDYFQRFMDNAHNLVVSPNGINNDKRSLVQSIIEQKQRARANNDPKVEK